MNRRVDRPRSASNLCHGPVLELFGRGVFGGVDAILVSVSQGHHRPTRTCGDGGGSGPSKSRDRALDGGVVGLTSRHDTLLSRLRERHLTGECGPQETRGFLPGEASQCRCRPDRARPGSGSAWSWKARRVGPPPSPWLAADTKRGTRRWGRRRSTNDRSQSQPTGQNHGPQVGHPHRTRTALRPPHGRASHTTFRQPTCAAVGTVDRTPIHPGVTVAGRSSAPGDVPQAAQQER